MGTKEIRWIFIIICFLFCIFNFKFFNPQKIIIEDYTTSFSLEPCEQDKINVHTRKVEEPIIEEEELYTQEELILLAAMVQQEAGMDCCGDRCQQLVAQVILNRVSSSDYPNTIYEVVTQKLYFPEEGEYHYMYITEYLADYYISHPEKISDMCYANALSALNGEVDCPSNIITQSGYIWGGEDNIYAEFEFSTGSMYFCYANGSAPEGWSYTNREYHYIELN